MPETRAGLVQIGAVRLYVREWGDPSDPPLVLLHGLASTSHMFDLIAPALAEQFHVIAPDQRGHGLSDKPSTGYDFETIAADLRSAAGRIQGGQRPVGRALMGGVYGVVLRGDPDGARNQSRADRRRAASAALHLPDMGDRRSGNDPADFRQSVGGRHPAHD